MSPSRYPHQRPCHYFNHCPANVSLRCSALSSFALYCQTELVLAHSVQSSHLLMQALSFSELSFAHQALSFGAIHLLPSTEGLQLRPNADSYKSMLVSCSKLGDATKGMEVFDR